MLHIHTSYLLYFVYTEYIYDALYKEHDDRLCVFLMGARLSVSMSQGAATASGPSSPV